MKKILVSLFVTSIAAIAFSQESFDANSRNFDIKLDMAGYSGTIKNNQTDSVRNASAVAIVLAPQMSWATGKKISLGASLAYSHYLDSSSSATSNPLLQGLDANFIFDFHFLRKPKTDMMAGFKLGIAGIRLDPNDASGDIYGSMGGAADIHFTARFYVSKRMGILANIAFPSYTFNKFGKNLNETQAVRFSGFCIGTGIAIKLSNQRTAGKQRG